MKRNGLITLVLILIALPATATETRCGWLENPTPANWWLNDRDGTWVISTQGGEQAEGMENIPDLSSEGEYVSTNGSYGYACACLDVETDSESERIVTIESVEQLPLSVCRADPDLPSIR